MRSLRRLHIWLGWVVAIPLLLWTVSGLWMVARPIEEVRGEHLRRAPVPLALGGPVRLPDTRGRTLKSLMVERQPSGPVWVLTYTDGEAGRADLATGRLLPALTAQEAQQIAAASYAGTSQPIRVTRTPADKPPLDLRRLRPAWAVQFGDSTRVYVDADSGSILALRTDQWRLFDLMWGLHILDPGGREDTSHPLLIAAAALGLAGVLTGVVLLFARGRKRRRAGT